MRQQAVNPRHPDIKHPLDPVTHHFGGRRRFLGHRHIAGTCRHHQDEPVGVLRQRFALQDHQSGPFVIHCIRQHRFHRSVNFRRSPAGQNIRADSGQLAHRPHDLFRGFTRAKHHFRKPLPQGTVMVDLDVVHVFERQAGQFFQRLRLTDRPRPITFQYFYDRVAIHSLHSIRQFVAIPDECGSFSCVSGRSGTGRSCNRPAAPRPASTATR